MNDEETLRRLGEAEARCVALREALEKVEALPWEAYSQEGGSASGEGDWLRTELRKGEEVLRHVREVLRADAGRDFLDRFRKLEAVAKAAREYLHDIDASVLNQPTIYQYEPGEDKSWRLRKALAALEGENNVDY